MIFNSFEFLVFLPVVWTVFWLLQRHLRLQNLWVVIASYVFYGWWDWRFLVLIAFISFSPQLVAGLIERATNLLPQFLSTRAFDYPQSVDGCRHEFLSHQDEEAGPYRSSTRGRGKSG